MSTKANLLYNDENGAAATSNDVNIGATAVPVVQDWDDQEEKALM